MIARKIFSYHPYEQDIHQHWGHVARRRRFPRAPRKREPGLCVARMSATRENLPERIEAPGRWFQSAHVEASKIVRGKKRPAEGGENAAPSQYTPRSGGA